MLHLLRNLLASCSRNADVVLLLIRIGVVRVVLKQRYHAEHFVFHRIDCGFASFPGPIFVEFGVHSCGLYAWRTSKQHGGQKEMRVAQNAQSTELQNVYKKRCRFEI